VDSLSNFPEFLTAGAPILLAILAAIGAALWLLKAAGRSKR
jgi:hypothetical protein